MRKYKITCPGTAQGTKAFSFFGYENGKAIYQSRKLWRNKSDCERAAKRWLGAGE